MINKEIQEQHIAERMTFFASNIADFEIGEEVKDDGTISKMLKRYINYIFPAYKLKFKIGDEVLIDKVLIKETYGYVSDMEYSGVVLKTFTASIFDGLCLDKFQDDKYTQIYLVRLNFTTGSTPYTGSDEEIWFTERNLSFASKVDDRDYKLNSLLEI